MSIEERLIEIDFYEEISGSFIDFEFSKYIDDISEYLSSNDLNLMKKLRKKVMLLIIKNQHFKPSNEDCFIDVINEIISKSLEEGEGEKKNDAIELYETVDFSKLSENKFREFISHFDYNEMTATIWNKLCECFYFNHIDKSENLNKDKEFKFDGNASHRFSGIFNYLRGNNNKKNISDEGIIEVTASTTELPHFPKYAVEFDSDEYFHSDDSCDWLQFDFKDKKIRPTHYSIKTSNDHDDQFPVNWCIEVSNTGDKNDWKIIDSRENVTSLAKRDQSDTFEVGLQLSRNENYRYIRFRSTGKTSGENCYNFIISSLEFFGTLKEEK